MEFDSPSTSVELLAELFESAITTNFMTDDERIAIYLKSQPNWTTTMLKGVVLECLDMLPTILIGGFNMISTIAMIALTGDSLDRPKKNGHT